MRDVDRYDTGAGRMRIPRSRGAVSGFLLVLLGLWGAFIPFVGPYFNFAYEPDTPWVWTAARGWLEVLPGVVTVAGGLLLLFSANRATALFGSWLAVVGGAWFVVGRLFATPLGLGDLGAPALTSQSGLIALELAFFTGVGSLIIALGGMALGRLSVRSLRDIRYARPSVDDYPGTVGREPIARERAVVGARDSDAEPVDDYRQTEHEGRRPVESERRHRDWRHPFGGARPVPH